VLSRPSPLLRPPPTPSRPPATSRALVIGGPASLAAGLSSSDDTLPTVPRPMRWGVRGHPLQVPLVPSVAFAHPSMSRLPLGPARAGVCVTTLQASRHAADGRLFHPASHPASRPRTGTSLPGTLASRPDSHRLAAVSLSLGYAVFLLLSLWRPNCWTHEGRRNSDSRPDQAIPKHRPERAPALWSEITLVSFSPDNVHETGVL